MERRGKISRLTLGLVLLVAALGPLSSADRAGATTGGGVAAARDGVSLARPALQGSDLAAGSTVQVTGTEGDGLRVRAEPTLRGEVQATLIEGARLEILAGPVAADSYRWYRVRFDQSGGAGWVAGQFLVAVSPSSPTTAGAAPSTGASTTGSSPAGTPAGALSAAAPPAGGAAAASGNAPVVPGTVAVPPGLADALEGTAGVPFGAPAAATAAAAPPAGAAPSALVPPDAAAAGALVTPADAIGGTGRYVRLGTYQASSPEYGMNVFVWGEANTTQRDLGMLRELGFTWQKTLFQWREIEANGKGQFDWREADRVISASTGAGVKVLARLDFSPRWACPSWDGRGNQCVPDRFEDYADFIKAFTTRYGNGSPIGRVHAIEVWNEPNLSREWGNKPINEAQARDYVRLLQLSYQAAKSVDPQMTIITAGLTPTGTENDEARPDNSYLQWMYDAGVSQWFDVLGAHGAGFRAPPQMSPDEVAADKTYGGHASFSFRRVEHLRDVMVRNGDDAKQVWLLEFGWTSDEIHPSYAWHRVTEDQKAEYIVGAYRWAKDNWSPWIGVMALWNLAAPGWTRNNEEYWWSISEPDGRPRPAYTRLLDSRRSGVLQ